MGAWFGTWLTVVSAFIVRPLSVFVPSSRWTRCGFRRPSSAARSSEYITSSTPYFCLKVSKLGMVPSQTANSCGSLGTKSVVRHVSTSMRPEQSGSSTPKR